MSSPTAGCTPVLPAFPLNASVLLYCLLLSLSACCTSSACFPPFRSAELLISLLFYLTANCTTVPPAVLSFCRQHLSRPPAFLPFDHAELPISLLFYLTANCTTASPAVLLFCQLYLKTAYYARVYSLCRPPLLPLHSLLLANQHARILHFLLYSNMKS